MPGGPLSAASPELQRTSNSVGESWDPEGSGLGGLRVTRDAVAMPQPRPRARQGRCPRLVQCVPLLVHHMHGQSNQVPGGSREGRTLRVRPLRVTPSATRSPAGHRPPPGAWAKMHAWVTGCGVGTRLTPSCVLAGRWTSPSESPARWMAVARPCTRRWTTRSTPSHWQYRPCARQFDGRQCALLRALALAQPRQLTLVRSLFSRNTPRFVDTSAERRAASRIHPEICTAHALRGCRGRGLGGRLCARLCPR